MGDSNNYQAIWAFQGETTGDLSFEAGDVIIVTSKSDPEWWEGYVNTNPSNIGAFPSTYVSCLDTSTSSSSSSSTNYTPTATLSTSSPLPYSSTNGNDDELNIKITDITVPEAERTFIIPSRYSSYQSHHPILQLRTLYRIQYTTTSTTPSTTDISSLSKHHYKYIRFSDLRTFATFLYTEMDNIGIPRSVTEDSYTKSFDTLLVHSDEGMKNTIDTKKRTTYTIEQRRLIIQEFLQRLIKLIASSSSLSSLLLSFLSHTDHIPYPNHDNEQKTKNDDDPPLGINKDDNNYYFMKLSTDDIATYMESITGTTVSNATDDNNDNGVTTASLSTTDNPNGSDPADGGGESLLSSTVDDDNATTLPVPDPIVTLNNTFISGTRIPFTIEDLEAFDYLLEYGYTILDEKNQLSSKQTNGTRCGQTVTAHWTLNIWDGAIDTAIETEKITSAVFTIGDYRHKDKLPIGLHKALESSCMSIDMIGKNQLYTIVLSPSLGYGEEGKEVPFIPKNVHLVYRIIMDSIEGEGRSMKKYQPSSNVSNNPNKNSSTGNNKFVIDSYHPVDDQLLSQGAAAMGITMATTNDRNKGVSQSMPSANSTLPSTAPSSSSLTAHLGINSASKPRPSPEEAEKAFRAYLESIGSPLPPDSNPGGNKNSSSSKSSSSGLNIFRRAFAGSVTSTNSSSTVIVNNGSSSSKAPPPAPPPKRRSKDVSITNSSSSATMDSSISPAAGIPYSSSLSSSSSSTNNANNNNNNNGNTPTNGIFSRIFQK